jgi:exoribonuclease R
MARRRVRAGAERAVRLRAGFEAIRTELGVPEAYPAAALAEAIATAREPRLPPNAGRDVVDARDIPLRTLDPAGSMDLDQALHLERRGRSGYRVHYAIADVASFVPPGGALDAETHSRGVTLYSPDLRTPLHPDLIGQQAASLLPDGDRPAVLWRIDLDGDGDVVTVDVRRARVRSRAKVDYESAQREHDSGDPPEWLVLLREVGERRGDIERARGAVDVRVPDQEIEASDGGYRLVARVPLPVEGWNAQLSLLTGMCAARMMLDGGVGVLRTMPAPAADDLEAVRRTALALGIDWDSERTYPELVRSLDPSVPAHAAFLEAATTLLRGAGYTAFDGAPPTVSTHSAVAASYAHVTAPLRRLVDRYGQETVVALAAGAEVPDWVRSALPTVAADMRGGDQLARRLDNACVDFMEAVLLEPRVGQVFDAVVVRRRSGGESIVQLSEPPARVNARGGGLVLGRRVRLRLMRADPEARAVEFAPA